MIELRVNISRGHHRLSSNQVSHQTRGKTLLSRAALFTLQQMGKVEPQARILSLELYTLSSSNTSKVETLPTIKETRLIRHKSWWTTIKAIRTIILQASLRNRLICSIQMLCTLLTTHWAQLAQIQCIHLIPSWIRNLSTSHHKLITPFQRKITMMLPLSNYESLVSSQGGNLRMLRMWWEIRTSILTQVLITLVIRIRSVAQMSRHFSSPPIVSKMSEKARKVPGKESRSNSNSSKIKIVQIKTRLLSSITPKQQDRMLS